MSIKLQSPIEFVVIGPQGDRDVILVRSENVNMDLVGFATQKSFDRDLESSSPESSSPGGSLFNSWIAGSSDRIMNVVESSAIEPYRMDRGKRKSSYRLSWVGYCSSVRHRLIHHAFDAHTADIQHGLHEENVEQIELSLAPVIYLCTKADQRRIRLRRMMYILFGTYAIIGLGGLISWLVRQVSNV